MKLRYASGRQAFGEKQLSWSRDAIVAYLVDATYQAADRHRSVRDLYGVIAGPVAVPDRSMIDGYARAGQIKFERVRSAERKAAALVIAARDGVLIVCTDEIEKFPVLPQGGDIEVAFDTFIFRL